jgi:hypothetical protein
MKLFKRPSKPKQRPVERGEGTNSTQRRPDPKAEPIPDGEHKYVPRSPYRTGND